MKIQNEMWIALTVVLFFWGGVSKAKLTIAYTRIRTLSLISVPDCERLLVDCQMSFNGQDGFTLNKNDTKTILLKHTYTFYQRDLLASYHRHLEHNYATIPIKLLFIWSKPLDHELIVPPQKVVPQKSCACLNLWAFMLFVGCT